MCRTITTRISNLPQAKKLGVICFPLGVIYCDQEPLRLLNVIELLTRCKICFTLELFENLRGGGGADFYLK